MAVRTATLWRLAQDWIDLEAGALLCAAEDFACAGNGAAAVGGSPAFAVEVEGEAVA